MSIEETQKQILESDEFVLSETKKIQYAYELKHVIRYSIDREEDIASESVAEHIYALHLLADYFLPLEDPEKKLDWRKVHDMLQYHDIDEIETGDMVGYLKTPEQRALEAEAMKRVILKFPEHVQDWIGEIVEEYDEQKTEEAKFAKALDRLEPMFQVYNDNGKRVMAKQKQTSQQSRSIKDPYIKHYQYLHRFNRVLQITMEKEAFFH